MRKVETQLITSDNQFGFKREHACTDIVYLLLNVLSNIITCIIVLCIHVFLTLLKPMIVLTTGHCLEIYSTDQFIFLLLECLCIGTQSKNYVLDGKLKCRHILLFLMDYDKGEYLSPSLIAVYMDDLS